MQFIFIIANIARISVNPMRIIHGGRAHETSRVCRAKVSRMFHLTKTVMHGPCLVQSMCGEVANIAVIDRYKAIWRTMSSFLYVYIVKTTFRRLRAGRDNLREILVTV